MVAHGPGGDSQCPRNLLCMLADDEQFHDFLFTFREKLKILGKRLASLFILVGVTDIVEARDGAEAVSMFGSANVQMVMLDWNMPEKNGLDVLREIREQQAFSLRTPRILAVKTSFHEFVIQWPCDGSHGFYTPLNSGTAAAATSTFFA